MKKLAIGPHLSFLKIYGGLGRQSATVLSFIYFFNVTGNLPKQIIQNSLSRKQNNIGYIRKIIL